MSSEGSCRFAVSSSMMCNDLVLEDQLDYEPDDQFNDKIENNVENESLKSFRSTVSNFESNFGKFRMGYIKHVDVEQDSLRSSYIPHVRTNMYDDPSISTVIDSSSEEGDLGDLDDIDFNDGILLKPPRCTDVQHNNVTDEALKGVNVTNSAIIPTKKNFLKPPKMIVSTSPIKKDSAKVIIHNQNVMSRSKQEPVRVTTSQSGLSNDIRINTPQTPKGPQNLPVSTPQTTKGPQNFCISFSTNSATRTVKANVMQPEKQTQTRTFESQLHKSQSHESVLSNVYATKQQPERRSHKRLWTTLKDCDEGVVKLTSRDSVISWNSDEPSPKRLYLDSICSSNSGSFRVPLKRPPTRKISCGPPKPEVPKQAVEDDLISIFAGTSILDPDERKEEMFDRVTDINPIGKRDLVQHWLETNTYDTVTDYDAVVNDYDANSSANNSTINENMNTNAETVPANNDSIVKSSYNDPNRTPFPPSEYKGLCFFYFFNLNGKRCKNTYCKRGHNLQFLPPSLERMHELGENRLLEVYDYARKFPKFYWAMFTKFCQAFAMKKMFVQMILVVEHIFDSTLLTVENFSRVTALMKLCDSFVKGAFGNFYESVEYILDECLEKVPDLGNVMTEFLMELPDLQTYWPLIKEIILAQKLDKMSGLKLLLALKKSPIDKKIANDVYKSILRHRFVDPNETPTMELLYFFKKMSTPEVSPKRPAERAFANSKETLINSDFVHSPTVKGVFGSYPVFPETGKRFEQGNFDNLVKNQPVFGTLNKARHEQPYGRSSHSENFENLAEDQLDFSSLIKKNKRNSSENMLESGNRHQPDFMNTGFENLDGNFSTRHGKRAEEENTIFDSLRDNRVGESLTRARGEPRLNFEPPRERQSKTYSIGEPNTDIDSRHSRKRQHNLDSDSGSGTVRAFSDNDNLSENESDRRPVQKNTKYPNIAGSRLGKRYIEHGLHYDPLHDYVDKAGSSNTSPFNFDEAIVSSSSDVKNVTHKPPEHPKFGHMRYDGSYEFNISLHIFYLQKLENVDISEDDVLRLNDAVKYGDGKEFLELLYKYKNRKTILNFITMTLAHLKGMNQMVASRFEALLSAIETEAPNYYGNLPIRVTLEVITMNLLFELDQRMKYKEAQKLLERFTDWDSLISSRLFPIAKAVSPIGRLLFIAKLLCHNKPELTFEILRSPQLHLLDSSDKWPYCSTTPATYDVLESDLKFRNEVLRTFLKVGYIKNMFSVTQLYKMVFSKRQGVYKFDDDLSVYFDSMIVNLINKNEVVYLKQIQANIDLFAPKMEAETLRAYVCIMYPSLSKPDAFKLYERSVQKGVYQCLDKGAKLTDEILIKTTILDEEIELIILYYFYKLSAIGNAQNDLKFKIRPPGGSPSKRLDILKTVRSISVISKAVKRVLLKLCSVETKLDVLVLDEIIVEHKTLKKYLDENKG